MVVLDITTQISNNTKAKDSVTLITLIIAIIDITNKIEDLLKIIDTITKSKFCGLIKRKEHILDLR